MSNYVLENAKEFERLEKQSQNEAYDYRSELRGFSPKEAGTILDAGCGSGVVSRYLAQLYPNASVSGCDASIDRVTQATILAQDIPNLKFRVENLNQMSAQNSSYDAIVCRYVLEHLPEEACTTTLQEFYRCLRPNGTLCIIDIDGFLHNTYPQTPLVQEVLGKMANGKPVDLRIGRKIPQMLEKSHFSEVTWSVETHVFQGQKLQTEIELLHEKFEQTVGFLGQFLGSQSTANQFVKEYFECLDTKGAVLFYNKFIVQAKKPGLIPIK